MNTKALLLGLLGIVVVAAMWLTGVYNGLVRQDQAVATQWAQVESQYQRRFDLIPNLVEATKGVLEQEREVFDQIAEARTRYAGAQSPSEQVEAAEQVESALARLLVIVENYPDLKSNETVQSLMDELAGTENRIAVERQRYNETVQTYNTQVKTVPTSLVAGMFGFAEKPYFEAVATAETAPEVDLSIE